MIKQILYLVIFMITAANVHAQVSTANNTGTSTDYVGWDANQNFPLNIRHNRTSNPQNINFFTNGTQKMTIRGSSGSTDGYVGIGTVVPLNLLHLHQSGTSAALYTQWSNGNTTNPAGLLIGIDESNNGIINMQDTKPINFFTNGTQKMTILGDNDPRLDGNVGIGGTPGKAKLHVLNENQPNAGFFHTDFNDVIPVTNAGVWARAEHGDNNIGGFFEVPVASNVNYAVKAIAGVDNFRPISTNLNYAGFFNANSLTGFNNGIYAGARPFTGNLPSWAGLFYGNAFATGDFYHLSDAMFKDSIENITGALSILSELQPKNFVYKTGDFPYMNLNTGHQFGLIAEQVDTVLPELVRGVIQPELQDSDEVVLMDSTAFKAINYTGLIPLTIAAINELNTAKITSCTTPTDSNYVTKWSAVNQTLCNSIVYDNGNQIGISTTDPESKVTIQNGNTDIAAIIGSMEDDFGTVISIDDIALIAASSSGNGVNIGTISVVSEEHANLNIGGAGKAIGDTAEMNIGWIGSATGNAVVQVNIGLGGNAFGTNDGSNMGVYGTSGGAAENFAVYAETEGEAGTNYAIWAAAGGSAPDFYAGWFSGDVTVTGTFSNPSDSRLKKNVEDIGNASELLSQLQPKDFEFKTEAYPDMNLPQGKQYGLIAQEVEAVLPELVSDLISPAPRDRNGKATGQPTEYKGVNYMGFIPLLISSIKEQQAVIDSMSSRLAEIESRMDNCCGGSGFKTSGDDDNVNRLTVELASLQAIVLDQNVPNPFAEQTSISYFIPEDNEGQAQVLFFDITGRVIKTVEVQKGYGIMTVFAHNLSTGSYSYSLMLNGKAVETKRMVKTK